MEETLVLLVRNWNDLLLPSISHFVKISNVIDAIKKRCASSSIGILITLPPLFPHPALRLRAQITRGMEKNLAERNLEENRSLIDIIGAITVRPAAKHGL